MIIFTDVNKNFNFSNIETIFNLLNKYRNFILYIYDYHCFWDNIYDEYKKYKDYFKKYIYYGDKLQYISHLNYSQNYHREDGPSQIGYYSNGEIFKKEYYLNGKQYYYEDYVLEINKLF